MLYQFCNQNDSNHTHVNKCLRLHSLKRAFIITSYVICRNFFFLRISVILSNEVTSLITRIR